MANIRIIEAEWINDTNSILCRVDDNDLHLVNNRGTFLLGPESFGLTEESVTAKHKQLLSEIAELLPGKSIKIEDGTTQFNV